MYNINMGGWLCATAAALGHSVGITRCGRGRHCVVGWTGRILALGQERFDKILAVIDAHIRSRGAGSVRRGLGPLESIVIGGDIGSLVE